MSVTRQATFNMTKIDEKCQNWKIQMRHFVWFSNNVYKEYIAEKGDVFGDRWSERVDNWHDAEWWSK